ncbi:MAG: SDR family oxidoreductase [Candidatus Eremiobacteraeota bacterium]|nr:SDR family oxidoreductase [Candidatus Eremiobacteraeota bacterium]
MAVVPHALKRVIVSGGGSGLGRATVDRIRAVGGDAISFDVRTTAAGDAAPEWAVDVSDRSSVERAVARLVEQHGPPSAVVTCAGVDACGPFGNVAAAAWERVIAVNLVGTATLVRAALPHLERSHGRIVTVASTLGLRAVSDATAYCASKFGVIGFSRALAAELADRVGVTCLIPGGMHTNFFDGRSEQYRPPADWKANQPSDVASAIIFALSQPDGCEIREMVVCPSNESSWP